MSGQKVMILDPAYEIQIRIYGDSYLAAEATGRLTCGDSYLAAEAAGRLTFSQVCVLVLAPNLRNHIYMVKGGDGRLSFGQPQLRKS